MDIPPTPQEDVLAAPVRRRLFEALSSLRRPASTMELAGLVGRHPNTVRAQLQRLADAGLLERRRTPQRRGRPRHAWAIVPGARPAGQAPQAHGQLSQWLARAIGSGRTELEDVEQAGRRIGRELAPPPGDRSVVDALRDALTALGFQPRSEARGPTTVRYVLGNCPYRDAVRENQPVVCTLHRGITVGLLDRLDPGATLTGFVARDPYDAGCLIELGDLSPV